MEEKIMISIHAPRVGSDNASGCGAGAGADFNPRSPRGSDNETVNFWQNIDISIHAPRVGSDSMSLLMVLI